MPFKQELKLIITLIFLWFALSANISLEHPLVLFFGVVSIGLVMYYSRKMAVTRHHGQHIYLPFLKVAKYWVWLFFEIIKANIAVAKLIMDPKMSIRPLLKTISAEPKTEVGRVVLANSITLTPGTVAINLTENDEIIVHALHEDDLISLETGVMGRKVADLEKGFPVDADAESS